jgi:hypothetical protein
VVDFLDLRLLLDPVYVNIAIGIGISFCADITYCALFPLVVLNLGFSTADSAICISILTAADIFGRLSVALIGAFSPQVSSRALFMAGAVTSVAGRASMSRQINCSFLPNIRQEKRSLQFRRKIRKFS